MELNGKLPVIINAGIGNWYKRGTERLERSLMYHGYPGELMLWKDEYPPNSEDHNHNPYGFKIAAFREAFKEHDVVMWLDSSFWCVKNPMPIFDIINHEGIFAFRTGYNCAQTCSDAALEWAGITRDDAEQLPEIATGMVGLRQHNKDADNVWKLWQEGYELGLFKTNRSHDLKDSSDPRFLHGRQDQSIFSLAIHRLGIKFEYVDFVSYYSTNYDPERVYFFIGGL
ncbi:MAG TPA: hypothetical protein VGZ90_13435 [Puia sp.]|jgi:hypothetical protein|nr:hypothetical protein [Puia sp.]